MEKYKCRKDKSIPLTLLPPSSFEMWDGEGLFPFHHHSTPSLTRNARQRETFAFHPPSTLFLTQNIKSPLPPLLDTGDGRIHLSSTTTPLPPPIHKMWDEEDIFLPPLLYSSITQNARWKRTFIIYHLPSLLLQNVRQREDVFSTTPSLAWNAKWKKPSFFHHS